MSNRFVSTPGQFRVHNPSGDPTDTVRLRQLARAANPDRNPNITPQTPEDTDEANTDPDG